MKKYFYIILLTQLAFSQSKPNNLQEKIYNEIDVFVANPTRENLKKVEVFQKNCIIKTDSEKLAFVILNCNIAYYQNQFGQTQKAISNYENAWQIFDKNKLSNYDIIESCLKPLGNLYTIIGDYDNAENTIKHYFFTATKQNNSAQKFAAILNLSNIYQNTGRIQEAIDLLEKTIKTDKLSNAQKGILYNNLGNNYFLNTSEIYFKGIPFQKGENSYLKAISLLKHDKSQRATLSNAYRNLANRYSQTQEFELANLYMEKARTLFFETPTNEPRNTAKLYVDCASLAFQQNKFEETKINLDAAFSTLLSNYSKSNLTKNTLYAETVLLDAFDLQAELFLTQNQSKKALESFSNSFYVEELLQSLLVYQDSKIITQIRIRNRTEKCLSIYNDLFQKEKKISYLEDAFLLQEKSKSAVLFQAISNSKTFSVEEKRIREQLQNWSNIIIKEQQKLDYADVSKINEAIKKQNELMLLLKSINSDYLVLRNDNFLNLNNLYSKLEKDKAVLVEYFYGSERIYVFTVQNKNIKLEFINNGDTTTPKIVQFLDYFSASDNITNDVLGYNHYSNLVYNMLKLPSKSTNQNMIIVPDGILTFLPFEALITKVSKTTNFARMNYLLNDFVISYSNSATFYLTEKPFKFDKESVLGIFPVFKNSALELTFSKNEMIAIQKQFKGNYFENEKATFSNFEQNATVFSILHLSTHASSGDIYEPASIKFSDQDILYSEFYNLEINPNLVVLSACETGIGKLYKAEGAMNIARGFQFAGAQNLLFSLWKVNDFTTSELMDNFYKNLKNRKSYVQANHDSKTSFLTNLKIPNAKKSPYYWSAFVYYGTLESKQSTNYFLWISIGVGIVGLVFLFLSFRRSRNLM